MGLISRVSSRTYRENLKMAEEQVAAVPVDAGETTEMTLQEQYHALLRRKAEAVYTNSHLQHKLAEHFRRKKTSESQSIMKASDKVDETEAGDAMKETTHEQRYQKLLSKLRQSQDSLAKTKEDSERLINDSKAAKEATEATERQAWSSLVELYKSIASQAVSSRTGKPIPASEIDGYIKALEKKEEEVTNKLKKKELQLQQKEELASGLVLIDFEQLKIENQTYNEKIEERNEELMKLHQKITNTVQVLTHYKEKLQFMETESAVQQESLKEIEEEVFHCRDALTAQKQERDRLRAEFHSRQQHAGLLGSIGSGNNANKKSLVLLKDFEERQDETDKLQQDIEKFQKRHAELTLDIKVIEKKLEKSKLAATLKDA